MYQTKRSSESNTSFPSHTKKLRVETSSTEMDQLTSIECLSNELFCEVFEYLDGGDIYKAFADLNVRLQNLLTCSSLLLKIKIHSAANLEYKECSKNVIIPNRHHIVSLDWENDFFIHQFFTHCIFDASFVRLQSLVLRDLSYEKAIMLIFYLKNLPQLSLLTMEIYTEEIDEFGDIYRMIFSLPFLKYNKLSLIKETDDDMTVSVPLAANEQLSSIEHLVINHKCTDMELLSILRHIPRLHRLICSATIEIEHLNRTELSTVLSSLTYIRFNGFFGDSNDLEAFMTRLLAPVEEMIIGNLCNESYLDAGRWERFITQRMPRLSKLQFTYGEYSSIDDYTPAPGIINLFASSFWIERQCLLEVGITNHFASCCIHSYRNLSLDIYKHPEIAAICDDNNEGGSSQLIQLRINRRYCSKQPRLFLKAIKSSFAGNQITRLNINCEHIPTGIFVQIIRLLPALNSLKVSSFLSIQSDNLFGDEEKIHFLTSINNKISKVNLQKATNLEQVNFILNFCLRMQYLQMDVPKDMDLQTILRIILINATTYISQLKMICFTFLDTNNDIACQLHTLIQSEKLLTNDYMIKCIGNHLLLKWN